MNEEFYRRQSENNQDHDRQKAAQQKHSTMETYSLEQQEAHAGHIPNPIGTDAEPPQPTLWQRIRKLIGL
jgi:hypothetical protein